MSNDRDAVERSPSINSASNRLLAIDETGPSVFDLNEQGANPIEVRKYKKN